MVKYGNILFFNKELLIFLRKGFILVWNRCFLGILRNGVLLKGAPLIPEIPKRNFE